MDSLDFLLWKVPLHLHLRPPEPSSVTLTGPTGQCHPGQVTWGSWQRTVATSAWFGFFFFFSPLLSSLPFFSLPFSPLVIFPFMFFFFSFSPNVSWLFQSRYAVASSLGPKSGALIWGVLGGRACDFSLVLKESLWRSQPFSRSWFSPGFTCSPGHWRLLSFLSLI